MSHETVRKLNNEYFIFWTTALFNLKHMTIFAIFNWMVISSLGECIWVWPTDALFREFPQSMTVHVYMLSCPMTNWQGSITNWYPKFHPRALNFNNTPIMVCPFCKTTSRIIFNKHQYHLFHAKYSTITHALCQSETCQSSRIEFVQLNFILSEQIVEQSSA
jgi:hypothetical protein